ncbi:hypothetical protein BDV25DRAFT_40180 [Aspergillus avenaceus]|uniref:Type 1 phosphatases regulator n=1 Tax=Aspergillus avenaceus TaxID=36643 RepID=A0A5N6TL63_ASPAV|nr:hypothetical protein BDV25DRAFT_40180 [Aspergillus avenaceus]
MSRSRQTAPSATHGSRVASLSQEPVGPLSTTGISGTLRLRAENDSITVPPHPNEGSRRIRWSEDVVDNEGMGKKSSKVCCIYHKSRPVGESSSESESSESSSSDSDSDEINDTQKNKKCHGKPHDRSCNDSDEHRSDPRRARGSTCCSNPNTRTKRRKPSPNAYEKMPRTTRER